MKIFRVVTIIASIILALISIVWTDSSVVATGKVVITGDGTLSGIVRFPDDYPEREKITTTKDQATCGAFKYSETFVVSEDNHGLKNVVVTVEGAKGKITNTQTAFKIEQVKCQYIPHVQTMPVGSKLEIFNNDGLLHNVHAYFDNLDPKSTVFNKAQPKFLKKITQTLDKVGMYYFKCDVHDHMSAFVSVVDHPFNAVTNETGEFSIENLPAGTYNVKAWHEALGTLEKTVTIEAGKTAEANFDILPN